jgi:gas vesicle protein
MNTSQMIAAVGIGAVVLGALFFGKAVREKNKMKEELEKLVVLAQEIRDPAELARVSARASVLSAQLLSEVLEQLKKNGVEQARSNRADERLQTEVQQAFGEGLRETQRLLKKIAGEEESTEPTPPEGDGLPKPETPPNF